MQQENRGKRLALIIGCSVVLLGLWVVALYVTYEDHQRTMLEQSIVHPGVVSYGTHSVATVPMTSTSPRRSSIPMISGVAVRHYAYSGHATLPSSESSHPVIHTISSSTVKTIGSGMSGSSAVSGSTSSSSARGIQYASPSVAMPTLAWASTSAIGGSTVSSPSAKPGIRMAKPSASEGEDGEWRYGGEGDWWYKDEDTWRSPYYEETRYDPTLGYTVVWNGSAWVKLTEYDPKVPIGDVPWLCMLFLCGMICIFRKNKVLLHQKIIRL